MFGDKENENMNFDSVPNISFNNEGMPVGGEFGALNNNAPQSLNGQFVPPAGMGIDEPVNNNFNNNNSFDNNSNNNMNTVVEPPMNMTGSREFNMFKCNRCNATFGVSNGGVVDKCIICHEHEIVNTNSSGNRIDGFIPFSISKNKAIETYKSKVMLNPIIPLCFKNSSTLSNIQKVYIPGYLYNTVTSGEVSLLGADQTPNGKAKYDVVFNNNVEHVNLFYKSSSKINERVFNAISNYNFNNVTMYDPNNIGQCYCLDTDVNQMDLNKKVEDNCMKHVISMVRKKVNHQMKKVVGNTLMTKIENAQNILVPVYLLNVRYNGKDYMFVMNGETGEFSLDVTNGVLEMVIFGILVGILVFGISIGISMLF